MSTAAMNPIAEMTRYIRGSISLARTKRRFAELLGWEAAEDIQADVVEHERKISFAAYAAEQADLEAERLIIVAQQPDSDGGVNITPREAISIARCVHRSAEIDHNISDATRT